MKMLLIMALSMVSLSIFAAPTCTKIIVNSNSVYIPFNLGKEQICKKEFTYVGTVFSHYSDLGVVSLKNAVALEKVGSLSCTDGRKFVLVNVAVTDSNNKEFDMVYAVSRTDILE